MNERTARQIREIRKAAKLNQERFAAELGVSQATVSRWEAGITPDGESLGKIARFSEGMQGWDIIDELERPYGAARIPRSITVVGRAETFVWQESHEWNESDKYTVRLPILNRSAHKLMPLVGYEIGDNSVELSYPAYSIVFGTTEFGKPAHGDRFVVATNNAETGLVEVSVRELRFYEDDTWLWPLSLHPDFYQTPYAEERVQLIAKVVYALIVEDKKDDEKYP